MVKVGYQGIEGSNSEEAAKKLCEIKGIKEFELVPLVTSRGVVEKLNRNEIDYGVMAYKNNIGGKVQETIDALSMINYELVGRCSLRRRWYAKSYPHTMEAIIQQLIT